MNGGHDSEQTGECDLLTVLEAVGQSLPPHRLRQKSKVDSLLAGKANAGHTHGISLYSGTAGDPPPEHLVEGLTGIDQ